MVIYVSIIYIKRRSPPLTWRGIQVLTWIQQTKVWTPDFQIEAKGGHPSRRAFNI